MIRCAIVTIAVASCGGTLTTTSMDQGGAIDAASGPGSDARPRTADDRIAAPPDVARVLDPRTYGLTASPGMVAKGQEIEIDWTAPAGASEKDRIGLYLKTEADDPRFVRFWVPTAGRSSGTATVRAPCAAGAYEFRYLAGGASNAIAQSNSVAVSEPPAGTPSACQGCTIHVAKNGSDTANSGGEKDPFATLGHAARVVKAGDTVCVREGTHAGFNAFRPLSGTEKEPIVFRPYPGEKVILDQALTPNSHTITLDSSAYYLTIEGFEMTDSRTALPECCNAIKVYCIYVDKSDSCADWGGPFTFRNLHIHHLGLRAIQMAGANVSIVDNYIHDLKGWGLFVFGKNYLVKGNVVHDVGGLGMYLGSPFDDGVVDGNVVHDVNVGNVADGEMAIFTWNAQRSLFKNNLIYGSVGFGIDFTSSGGGGNKVYNNTITAAMNDGFVGNTGVALKNNIVFGNGGANLSLRGATSERDITTDPLFADRAKHDYRLRPGSPALDSGLTLSEVREDLEGRKRPQSVGGAYDVGAYEMP